MTFTRPVAAHVDLPATAILEKDGKTFVWVVDPAKNTVSQREVTVARARATVVVTSGIAAGERIVIAGVHSLKAGQAAVEGAAMNGFNLSDLGAQHRSFVWYLML